MGKEFFLYKPEKKNILIWEKVHGILYLQKVDSHC